MCVSVLRKKKKKNISIVALWLPIFFDYRQCVKKRILFFYTQNVLNTLKSQYTE